MNGKKGKKETFSDGPICPIGPTARGNKLAGGNDAVSTGDADPIDGASLREVISSRKINRKN